jgi:hypothetical protein
MCAKTGRPDNATPCRIRCSDNLFIARAPRTATIPTVRARRLARIPVLHIRRPWQERPTAAHEGLTMMDGRDKKLNAAHRARTDGDTIPGRFLRLRLRPRRWIFCLATCWNRIPTSHASAMTSSTPSLQRAASPCPRAVAAADAHLRRHRPRPLPQPARLSRALPRAGRPAALGQSDPPRGEAQSPISTSTWLFSMDPRRCIRSNSPRPRWSCAPLPVAAQSLLDRVQGLYYPPNQGTGTAPRWAWMAVRWASRATRSTGWKTPARSPTLSRSRAWTR